MKVRPNLKIPVGHLTGHPSGPEFALHEAIARETGEVPFEAMLAMTVLDKGATLWVRNAETNGRTDANPYLRYEVLPGSFVTYDLAEALRHAVALADGRDPVIRRMPTKTPPPNPIRMSA